MGLLIIGRRLDPVAKVEEYFALSTPNLNVPFVLGGQSADPDLPPIAQWGAASSFGLDDLDNLDGTRWQDWRTTMHRLGCDWVIPIIEQAKLSGDVSQAVRQIQETALSMGIPPHPVNTIASASQSLDAPASPGSLPIPPEVLEPAPLSGKSAARSIWRRKTANIFRGVFELDCTGMSRIEIAEHVFRTVKVEYQPGALIPFAFGVVLYFSSDAPPSSELEGLIDDRARSRGTWQWLIVVDQSKKETYGIHMWAHGYLTPVFGALLHDLESRGFSVVQHFNEPGQYWNSLWATVRSLLAARKALVVVVAALSVLLFLYRAFAP